jgi:primosomal protein N''
MVTEEQKRYAKVAQLSLRVYLNTQAMLSHISRQISSNGKAGSRMDPELFQRSLEDLESCLDEFENLTGINMIHAKTLHAQSLTALERKDLSSVYELVQKLYRDGYLSTLIELTK